jgi:hypothetical protein
VALTQPASLLQVFKIITVSFVAQLTAMSTLTRSREGCARPSKFWQQLLRCCRLFQIHMATISALKAHFPTIHHHFNTNLRCLKLNQPSAILTT